MSLNLTSLIRKYDPVVVETNLQNLEDDLNAEMAAEAVLLQQSEQKTEAVLDFLDANKNVIADQHTRLTKNIPALIEKVNNNSELEAADAAYVSAVASDDAQKVALQLAEINALTEEYLVLLKKTGRSVKVLR
jgi:patatin-like phospholipase/acyl hydrolase